MIPSCCIDPFILCARYRAAEIGRVLEKLLSLDLSGSSDGRRAAQAMLDRFCVEKSKREWFKTASWLCKHYHRFSRLRPPESGASARITRENVARLIVYLSSLDRAELENTWEWDGIEHV